MSEVNIAAAGAAVDLTEVDANISATIHQATPMTPIETVPQFAGYVINWHDNKVARLEHYLTIPEGTTVEVQDAPGNPASQVTLTGDALLAFKAGILAALNEFAQLPFAPLASAEDGVANTSLEAQGQPADVG